MSKLSFLLIFCLGFTLAQAQTSDQTLVKTLNPEEAESIVIDLKHKDLEAEPWDEKTIRIQLEVHANMPEQVLKQLVKAGRYAIEYNLEDNMFHINAPNLKKTVTIGGKDLEEEIYIFAQTPGYYAVDGNRLEKNIPDGVLTQVVARANDLEEAKAKLKEMSKIKEKIDRITIRFVYKGDDKGKRELAKTPAATMDRAVSRPNPAKDTNGKAGSAKKELQDVQAKYGDILIDGVPLVFD